VVQGSALGPFLYSINATDFVAIVDGNVIFKYADDFDLIVPSCNTLTIPTEIINIEKWANSNNQKLNKNKTKEMIIYNKYNKNFLPPSETPGVLRVNTLKILGVYVDSKLNFSDHINDLLTQGTQRLYILKLLKQHGLNGTKLWEVARAIFINKITYAAPAWLGFCSSGNIDRLCALIDKAIKWGVYSKNSPTLSDILNKLDAQLFKTIKNNPKHILHPLLPPVKSVPHNLRFETFDGTSQQNCRTKIL